MTKKKAKSKAKNEKTNTSFRNNLCQKKRARARENLTKVRRKKKILREVKPNLQKNQKLQL
jgi:hypothetical protein